MKYLLYFCLLIGLTACGSTSHNTDYEARWAVMPMHNFSANSDKDAPVQLESLLTELLSTRGAAEVVAIPETTGLLQNDFLNQANRRHQAQQWVMHNNVDFILQGSIEEWGTNAQQLSEVDIHLELIDTAEDTTLWQTRVSAVGRPGETPLQTAQKVLKNILEGMPAQIK